MLHTASLDTTMVQTMDRPRPRTGSRSVSADQGTKRVTTDTSQPDFSAQMRAIADHADEAAFAQIFAHFAPRIKAPETYRFDNCRADSSFDRKAIKNSRPTGSLEMC